MKTCDTCEFWGEPIYGTHCACYHPKLAMDETYDDDDSLGKNFGEEIPRPWTGPKFGCVHHEDIQTPLP